VQVNGGVTSFHFRPWQRGAGARFAARLAVAVLTLVAAGCDHLKMFEDTPQTVTHAPARKPGTVHGQQTTTLRGTSSGEESAAPVAAVGPPLDPARATQLRAQALEQMNRGAINDAVANLQQATTLDPGNALIRRDLDRALRIQSTVQAQPS
jgi:hypothetical protein